MSDGGEKGLSVRGREEGCLGAGQQHRAGEGTAKARTK